MGSSFVSTPLTATADVRDLNADLNTDVAGGGVTPRDEILANIPSLLSSPRVGAFDESPSPAAVVKVANVESSPNRMALSVLPDTLDVVSHLPADAGM